VYVGFIVDKVTLRQATLLLLSLYYLKPFNYLDFPATENYTTISESTAHQNRHFKILVQSQQNT